MEKAMIENNETAYILKNSSNRFNKFIYQNNIQMRTNSAILKKYIRNLQEKKNT